MDLHIKFRPTKPRSPHLNGKVERTQRTDWEEFYSLVDLKASDLPEQLQQWQTYYNRERRHIPLAKVSRQALVDSLPGAGQQHLPSLNRTPSLRRLSARYWQA